MLLFGIVPAGLILTTLVIVTALRMFASARNASEAALRLMADRVAAEIERGNTRAVLASKMLVFAQMDGLFGQRMASLAYARRVLEQLPEFTGAYFAYEPNADGHDQEYANTPAAADTTKTMIRLVCMETLRFERSVCAKLYSIQSGPSSS